MNQTTPKISGNLTGAAFGASLAMLPIAVIMLLSIFEIFKGGSESFGKAIIILQFIGCLIWAGCIVGVFNNAKKLNVSTGGLALCIPGIIIGGILQIIAVVEPDLIAKFIRFGNGDVDAFFIILLITIVVNLPLAIGTLMVGKNLHALRRASFGYILLSFFPLYLFFPPGTRGNRSISPSGTTMGSRYLFRIQ